MNFARVFKLSTDLSLVDRRAFRFSPMPCVFFERMNTIVAWRVCTLSFVISKMNRQWGHLSVRPFIRSDWSEHFFLFFFSLSLSFPFDRALDILSWQKREREYALLSLCAYIHPHTYRAEEVNDEGEKIQLLLIWRHPTLELQEYGSCYWRLNNDRARARGRESKGCIRGSFMDKWDEVLIGIADKSCLHFLDSSVIAFLGLNVTDNACPQCLTGFAREPLHRTDSRIEPQWEREMDIDKRFSVSMIDRTLSSEPTLQWYSSSVDTLDIWPRCRVSVIS